MSTSDLIAVTAFADDAATDAHNIVAVLFVIDDSTTVAAANAYHQTNPTAVAISQGILSDQAVLRGSAFHPSSNYTPPSIATPTPRSLPSLYTSLPPYSPCYIAASVSRAMQGPVTCSSGSNCQTYIC